MCPRQTRPLRLPIARRARAIRPRARAVSSKSNQPPLSACRLACSCSCHVFTDSPTSPSYSPTSPSCERHSVQTHRPRRAASILRLIGGFSCALQIARPARAIRLRRLRTLLRVQVVSDAFKLRTHSCQNVVITCCAAREQIRLCHHPTAQRARHIHLRARVVRRCESNKG